MVATVPSEPGKSCDPDVGARKNTSKTFKGWKFGVVEGLESDDAS